MLFLRIRSLNNDKYSGIILTVKCSINLKAEIGSVIKHVIKDQLLTQVYYIGILWSVGMEYWNGLLITIDMFIVLIKKNVASARIDLFLSWVSCFYEHCLPF